MKDARGFHEENGPFIQPLFFFFEDLEELVEPTGIVVDTERFADQFPIGSQHGHQGEFRGHINANNKIMQILRQR